MTKAAIMPNLFAIKPPKQKVIAFLFHFLCYCVSSFSNCTKYFAYLSSEYIHLCIGMHDKPIGIAGIKISKGVDVGM